MNNDIPDSTIDLPDERDIAYSVLLGSSNESLAVEFPYDTLAIQDQSSEWITRMACSRFGMTHIVNGQTLITGNTQDLKGVDLWKRYLIQNPTAESDGATLQSALAQAKREGLIGWYGTIETMSMAKLAIDLGHFIYTGSFNGDWTSVRTHGIYALRTDRAIVGHVWVIVGYDNDWFQAINSYGQKNGYFTLPYELFFTTFTKYAILPGEETNQLLTYRLKLMDNIKIDSARDALTNGFWNWERPQDTVTREEAAAMAERVYEKISKNS